MRDLSAPLRTHLAQRVTRTISLVRVDVATQPLRLHDDVGIIRWNGDNWTGAGDLGRVEPVDEDGDLAPDSFHLTLSGLDETLLGNLRSENHVGVDVRIWLAARDLATGALVGQPLPVLSGVVEDATVSGGGRTGAISLTVADERALLGRSAGVLFDDGQQRRRHANDGFFQHVAFAGEREVIWGPGGTGDVWEWPHFDPRD